MWSWATWKFPFAIKRFGAIAKTVTRRTEDFTLTYNNPSSKWSTTAYTCNLSDQKILSRSFVYGLIGPLANVLPPGTCGVRVNAKFQTVFLADY